MPKFGLFFILAKFLYILFGNIFYVWSPLLYALGIASIIIGSVGGLNQTSFLRLLAYSTITDMGYVTIALSYGDFFGLHASITYFLIHTLSSITVFSFLASVHTNDNYSLFNSIYDFSFLKTQNHVRLTPLIAMISYMSIPPLAGFLGKIYIFGILMAHGEYLTLLVLCMAFSASLFFYSRIIRNLLFQSEYHFAPFIDSEELSQVDLFIVAALNIFFITLTNHFMIYTVDLTQYFLVTL
jgi:NADH-quinone oxidoreductase subunit N